MISVLRRDRVRRVGEFVALEDIFSVETSAWCVIYIFKLVN